MESPTKNRQTVETIEALVDAAYGARQVPKADGSIVELKRGRFNAVYRVRLRDGRDVALKIAPSPEVNVLTYEQRLMANELAAIELIARRSAAPVPHVEHIFDGAGPVGAPCFFMAFVDGENLGELLEHGEKADAPRLDHLMTELGRVNRV
ncbi:MAG: phosphotransferase family protein, partial [Microbacterium aurantiacum]|uniref:phosphotransferase family protein n=2 Tax=Microbacteriaceae TaxID=85023 RepID=UPI00403715F4